MPEVILVPQVGQDLTEAKIVALFVKLGDSVKHGDIVAEVESEKATFEVEAFSTGVVIDLPYKAGDLATVLEPLMVLGEAGQAVAQPQRSERQAVPQAQKPGPAKKDAASILPSGASAGSSGDLRSSPLARRVAQSNGIALDTVAGSGPHGAVVLRDVEAHLKQNTAGSRKAPSQATGMGAIRTLREGTQAPVLFIHGFGGDLSSWRAFVGALDFPNAILALDLPGHGASCEAPAPSFSSMVDSVAASLEAAGHTRIHLVAHSLGAAIAIALSGRTGFDVRSLTLLSPAGLGPTINGNFISGFLEARSEAALVAQMDCLVHDAKSIPPAMIRATMEARETGPVVLRQKAVAEAVFENNTQLFSVKPELGAYKGPCHVIVGRRDRIIAIGEVEAAVPGRTALHRLEDTGHLPQLEMPAVVTALVEQAVRAGN
jgi:pyruvate dehydrogenase E2 component (dihydrolipoamide acetyltransferase)